MAAVGRLVKGLYGHEFKHDSRLFGLCCGQIRSNDTVHNGGWYNQAGEKLGWGDLSTEDILRLTRELLPGEIFLVLPESASFWAFVTEHGVIGSDCKVKPDIEAPGKDYVLKHARFVIVPGACYYVQRDTYREPGSVIEWRGGLQTPSITPEKLAEFLG